jgi:osomolarity two-component system phosphorelay intermediate protein YPD1
MTRAYTVTLSICLKFIFRLTCSSYRAKKDFGDLSQLGHFLKGSSATLGLTKVKDACEKIQHCKEDLPDEKDEREKSIEGIKKTLKEVQVDYKEVANILRRFFGEEPVLDTTDEKKETTVEKKPESPKAEKK